MGWLIDPSDRSILIFPQKQQPELKQEVADILPIPHFVTDLNLKVGDVLNWLKL
jgi:hypothetical protein